ncbi:MAG: adenylyltransferase/cytidyltransferase family protein [Opitutales bacterium]|nr:adenylyltransferase/cytidyltransferase family protein [Opitutales bacterium]MCH8475214.1 adenylyltransferase/cytidyltransferase family protein [Opitutales bacterium]
MELKNPKLRNLEEAVTRRLQLRQQGQTLVLTNGCFDLLHAGHVHYLQAASQLGDELWVLVNSDDSVRSLKGPHRPVQKEEHRAYVLSALSCIDLICLFTTPRLDQEIRQLQPDVYTKAGDYGPETLNQAERKALTEVKADIRFVPFLEGFSSSQLMERINATTQLPGK